MKIKVLGTRGEIEATASGLSPATTDSSSTSTISRRIAEGPPIRARYSEVDSVIVASQAPPSLLQLMIAK